jgi:hypothetical protein
MTTMVFPSPSMRNPCAGACGKAASHQEEDSGTARTCEGDDTTEIVEFDNTLSY